MGSVDDFFSSRLDQMIGSRHPPATLAPRMPWLEIEAALASQLAGQAKAGKPIEALDLFGAQAAVVGGGRSNAGRPRLPIRLMVSPLYLKYAFNESDEGVVERWSEALTWQYFSGMDYFEHRPPCDATLIGKFRRLLREAGVEELPSQTIRVAIDLRAIRRSALQSVVVDTTVQPEAVVQPTGSRLLEAARQQLAHVAKVAGIALNQTFAKEAKQLTREAGGYADARQFRRLRKPINCQRTIVGKLSRQIACEVPQQSAAHQAILTEALGKAHRILAQTHRHKIKGAAKLYSWHAPETECLSKGTARQPCEFGVKVGITSTLKGNLILGARNFPGNPYDGHNLAEQLEQASILSNRTIKHVYDDLGYRRVEQDNAAVDIHYRGKHQRLSVHARRLLKRRQAIEPMINHLKSDHRMNRYHLKGAQGDGIHAVLCAAGYNLRWLLRTSRKKGDRLLFALIRRLGLNKMLAQLNIGAYLTRINVT
jgi:IS5 family transposase